MNLEHFQKNFSQFLYDPHKKKGELAYYFTDEKALNHYHQSLLYNLIETLTENFSKTSILLGEDNFKFFARKYIYCFPSSKGNLDYYGENFPSFLSQQNELNELYYIEDFASLDFFWHNNDKDIRCRKGVFDLWSSLHHDHKLCEPLTIYENEYETIIKKQSFDETIIQKTI